MRFLIFDAEMGNECAAAFALHQAGLDVQHVMLDRSNAWALPENHSVEMFTAQDCTFIGTYHPALYASIEAVAKTATWIVYGEADVTSPNRIWARDSLLDVLWTHFGVTGEPNEVARIFDRRQHTTGSERDRAIMQAVKSALDRTLYARVQRGMKTPVEDLVSAGQSQLPVADASIRLWYGFSKQGALDGLSVRICHAHPYIRDTIEYCMREDSSVQATLVYRCEYPQMRFTLARRRDLTEIDCQSIATKYGGGGQTDMAGFALSMVDGAALLARITA